LKSLTNILLFKTTQIVFRFSLRLKRAKNHRFRKLMFAQGDSFSGRLLRLQTFFSAGLLTWA